MISILAINLPKQKFNKYALQELKDSIHRTGLRHPILVTRNRNNKFRIIDGAYRVKACKELGHTTIDAIVINNY